MAIEIKGADFLGNGVIRIDQSGKYNTYLEIKDDKDKEAYRNTHESLMNFWTERIEESLKKQLLEGQE